MQYQRRINLVLPTLTQQINQRCFHVESMLLSPQRCFDVVKVASIQFAFSIIFQRLTNVSVIWDNVVSTFNRRDLPARTDGIKMEVIDTY